MADELDEYLQVGSPFLREVDLSLLNAVIRDLFLEQDYNVSQALAKPLILIEATSVLGAISKNPGKYVPTTQKQLRRDMAEYYIGFTRPFRLLQLACLARQTGLEQAKKLHSRLSAENAERYFLHENLSFALTLLRADPSGVRFINQLVQKELAEATNLYYKLGLEAARRIFLAYTEILATLIPNSEHEEEKQLTSLLARLSKYEETAPPSPQSQPINPILKQMEEVLVKSAEGRSLWKAVGVSFFLFFKLLFQKPRYIRTSFSVVLRFIHALRKNPSATMQRWERIDDMRLRIQETAQRVQQSGEVLTQLHPELTDFVESTFPHPPYPAKTFVQDMQRIRTLRPVGMNGTKNNAKNGGGYLPDRVASPSLPALRPRVGARLAVSILRWLGQPAPARPHHRVCPLPAWIFPSLPWKALLVPYVSAWCSTDPTPHARRGGVTRRSVVRRCQRFFLRSPFRLQCMEDCLQHGCTDWQPAKGPTRFLVSLAVRHGEAFGCDSLAPLAPANSSGAQVLY